MEKTIPQTIRIDPEVWLALQKLAEPFVETPNDVLRRVLGLGDPAPSTKSDSPTGTEGGSLMNIPQALKQAGIELQKEIGDKYMPVSRLRERAHELCGYPETSILPSDFCYNRKNKGSRKPEMFLWKEGDFYRYVGESYSYSGEIIRKPKGR
jgi:hypothetical protein